MAIGPQLPCVYLPLRVYFSTSNTAHLLAKRRTLCPFFVMNFASRFGNWVNAVSQRILIPRETFGLFPATKGGARLNDVNGACSPEQFVAISVRVKVQLVEQGGAAQPHVLVHRPRVELLSDDSRTSRCHLSND